MEWVARARMWATVLVEVVIFAGETSGVFPLVCLYGQSALATLRQLRRQTFETAIIERYRRQHIRAVHLEGSPSLLAANRQDHRRRTPVNFACLVGQASPLHSLPHMAPVRAGKP
jgi:hypothetical protein